MDVLKTLMTTIEEKSAEIEELRQQVAELEFMLASQQEEVLAGQLAELLFEHPETNETGVIASIRFH